MISCNGLRNGIIAEIKNDSKGAITNIVFSSDKKTKLIFKILKPNQTIRKALNMINNEKRDGSYKLVFYRLDGKREEIDSGYYTNGGSLDSKVIYTIRNDTVEIKFSGPGPQ